LGLHSAPGKGCLFQLELPLAKSQDCQFRNTACNALTSSGKLNGLSLLVVDNEPAIIEGMRRLLEGWGCKVDSACSADAARQAVLRRASRTGHMTWC
jgi:hypothetical protein